MQIHCNAKTNPEQRLIIQNSSESCRTLARRFVVSPATILKWRKRDSNRDRSCAPIRRRYALGPQEEQIVLFLRRLDVPMDDILDKVAGCMPHLTRSSLYRLLVRHEANRLSRPEKEQSGKFKEYPPGYLHIDYFFLPRIAGKSLYCFVAIDRATRLVFLQVYDRQTKEVTRDFLSMCLEFYPFRIRKILTDNSRSFTRACFRNARGTRTLHPLPFEELCRTEGIEHRQIKPRTPKTNGLVERAIGLIQEATTGRYRYANAKEMVEALHNWFVMYNFYRPNRRIGRVTPYDKVCRYYELEPELFIKEPTHLLNYRSQCGET